jgi:Protein of unknown function (DUF1559)
VFVSPADPTFPPPDWAGPDSCSYAANGQVFVGEPKLLTTFADGKSNTIAFAEHYTVCGDTRFGYSLLGGDGRATFAENNAVHPITSGDPPESRSSWESEPGVTFQAAPPVADCNPAIAQTPHASGMLIAMADGSVHILSPSISPATYWALITPAGGETICGD